MKGNDILKEISLYEKELTREMKGTELEALEEMLKEKGSFTALSSAYYFGYIQALKEKGVIR